MAGFNSGHLREHGFLPQGRISRRQHSLFAPARLNASDTAASLRAARVASVGTASSPEDRRAREAAPIAVWSIDH